MRREKIKKGDELWFAEIIHSNKINKRLDYIYKLRLPRKVIVTDITGYYIVVEDNRGYTLLVEEPQLLFETELEALEGMCLILSEDLICLNRSYTTQKTTLEKKLILRK